MPSKTVEAKIRSLTREVAKGARKYNVPNNILSTWIKNKDKIIQSYRECGNVKRRRVRYSPNENLEKLFTNGYLR